MRIESPDWHRSISLPPKENLSLYLEAKSVFGENANSLSYEKFEKETAEVNWKPPMTNQGFILPSY